MKNQQQTLKIFWLFSVLITGIVIPSRLLAQTGNMNYTIIRVPRISGITDTAALNTASADKNKVQISISYADGLGRPQQKHSKTGIAFRL